MGDLDVNISVAAQSDHKFDPLTLSRPAVGTRLAAIDRHDATAGQGTIVDAARVASFIEQTKGCFERSLLNYDFERPAERVGDRLVLRGFTARNGDLVDTVELSIVECNGGQREVNVEQFFGATVTFHPLAIGAIDLASASAPQGSAATEVVRFVGETPEYRITDTPYFLKTACRFSPDGQSLIFAVRMHEELLFRMDLNAKGGIFTAGDRSRPLETLDLGFMDQLIEPQIEIVQSLDGDRLWDGFRAA